MVKEIKDILRNVYLIFGSYHGEQESNPCLPDPSPPITVDGIPNLSFQLVGNEVVVSGDEELRISMDSFKSLCEEIL